MLLKRVFILLIWGCVLISCAKDSSNKPINEDNFIKVQSLNAKILFLQKIINAEGNVINKEPYPYSIDFVNEQGMRLHKQLRKLLYIPK